MTQVQNVYQHEDSSSQSTEQNQFETVEMIVNDIVEHGIPKSTTLSNFIVQVSKTYGINVKEAKTCIRLAMSELSQGEDSQTDTQNELYGQCGYFYPSGYNVSSSPKAKNDGMDSLSCLGSYNKLMFLR